MCGLHVEDGKTEVLVWGDQAVGEEGGAEVNSTNPKVEGAAKSVFDAVIVSGRSAFKAVVKAVVSAFAYGAGVLVSVIAGRRFGHEVREHTTRYKTADFKPLAKEVVKIRDVEVNKQFLDSLGERGDILIQSASGTKSLREWLPDAFEKLEGATTEEKKKECQEKLMESFLSFLHERLPVDGLVAFVPRITALLSQDSQKIKDIFNGDLGEEGFQLRGDLEYELTLRLPATKGNPSLRVRGSGKIEPSSSKEKGSKPAPEFTRFEGTRVAELSSDGYNCETSEIKLSV